MRVTSLILLSIVFLSACSLSDNLTLKTDDYQLRLNKEGQIESLELPNGIIKEVHAYSTLKGCKVTKVAVESSSSKAIVFSKNIVDTLSGRECKLTEKFSSQEGSIQWEVSVIDDGENWTTPIETILNYPTNEKTKVWMPWADPRGDVSGGGTDNALIANAIIGSGDLSDFNSWADPLVSIPLDNNLWHYGAPRYTYESPGILYCPFQGDVLCIPMVSVLEEESDFGLTLALSPQDLILDVNLETKKSGELKFTRFNHRMGKGNELKFSANIIVHEADWRSSLGWMSENYPEYFKPVNDLAHEIAGTGAYSNSDVEFDVEKMKKMGFRLNWRASFDFPYMGMFIPPVDDKEIWPSFVRERNIGIVKRKPTSIPKMQDYCKRMDDNGFFVLSYFNVTEFGTLINYPRQESKRKEGIPIWKDANDYLYENLADAMLYAPEKQVSVTDKGIYSSYPGKPYMTWEKAVVMDPGVKSYQDFLVEQAKRNVNTLTHSYGICIDRMDWTRFYNHKTDDGVSWMGDQAVGSVHVSWHKIMERLDSVYHNKNKVIFVNNHVKRIDQLRYVDGIFDEFTYAGSPINTVGLMCTHKPALGWMSEDKQLLPNPDEVMQKYLYMGIFPMAPFPGNDHSMRPSKLADEVYLDYGVLFDLMRGKEWVLKPHVILAKDNSAKVNLFKTFHGYTIPVMYAQTENVEVSVNDPDILNANLEILAFYPGQENGEKIAFNKVGEQLIIDVPIKRNCAMLKLVVN